MYFYIIHSLITSSLTWIYLLFFVNIFIWISF